jgi:PII-like signaling protein
MEGEQALVLRCYVNADSSQNGTPLYELLLLSARQFGLAGASVFSADSGYGEQRIIHEQWNEYAFTGSPIVVEIIDREERLQQFISEIRGKPEGGCLAMALLSPVQVIRYCSATKEADTCTSKAKPGE